MTPRPIDPRNHHNTTWDETSTPACTCQDQHRRGYCTEPGCPYSPASTDAGALAEEIVAVAKALFQRDIEEDICDGTWEENSALHLKFFKDAEAAIGALRNSAPQETRGDEPVAWRWKYKPEHIWQYCGSNCTPPVESISERLYAASQQSPRLERDEILRGLAEFFSESVHHVWSNDEIADCLTGMIDQAAVPSTDRGGK